MVGSKILVITFLGMLLLLTPSIVVANEDADFGCCCTLQDPEADEPVPVGNLQLYSQCPAEPAGKWYNAQQLGYEGPANTLPITLKKYVQACDQECDAISPEVLYSQQSLSGVVIDKNTLNPKSDVLVYVKTALGYQTTISNHIGEYSLTNIPRAENLVLNAVHEECIAYTDKVDVINPTTYDIKLDCEIPDCPKPPVELNKLSHVAGEPAVLVNYSLPETGTCPDPSWAVLTRCDGDDCFDQTISLSADEVKDNAKGQGLNNNTLYDYSITTYYGIISNTSENTLSITTGDYYCMNNKHVGEFCYDNDVRECLPNNSFENVQACIGEGGLKSTCVQVVPGVAQCEDQYDCSNCNAFLGAFPDFIKVIFPNEARLCSAQSSCYEDVILPTTFSAYDECSDVTSCYDYHSKDTCTDDPCKKFSKCQWTDTAPNLGGGVCTPPDSEVSCKECEDLGGACDEAVCQSFGSCYYDTEDNDITNPEQFGVTGCVDKDLFGCRFYDNQRDCVNANGKDTGIILHVTYEGGKRIGGTNEILTESDDFFGFGTCAWNEEYGYCVKDANGDRVIPGNIDFEDGKTGTDPVSFLSAKIDNEPPSTTILLKENPWYTLSDLRNISKVVTDNIHPKNKLTTYFCLNEPGETPCYPQEIADFMGLPSGSEPGEYHLRYYSEDAAENLEVVQQLTVLLQNTTVPEVLDWRIE